MKSIHTPELSVKKLLNKKLNPATAEFIGEISESESKTCVFLEWVCAGGGGA